jgi:hypothetical protein
MATSRATRSSGAGDLQLLLGLQGDVQRLQAAAKTNKTQREAMLKDLAAVQAKAGQVAAALAEVQQQQRDGSVELAAVQQGQQGDAAKRAELQLALATVQEDLRQLRAAHEADLQQALEAQRQQHEQELAAMQQHWQQAQAGLQAQLEVLQQSSAKLLAAVADMRAQRALDLAGHAENLARAMRRQALQTSKLESKLQTTREYCNDLQDRFEALEQDQMRVQAVAAPAGSREEEANAVRLSVDKATTLAMQADTQLQLLQATVGKLETSVADQQAAVQSLQRARLQQPQQQQQQQQRQHQLPPYASTETRIIVYAEDEDKARLAVAHASNCSPQCILAVKELPRRAEQQQVPRAAGASAAGPARAAAAGAANGGVAASAAGQSSSGAPAPGSYAAAAATPGQRNGFLVHTCNAVVVRAALMSKTALKGRNAYLDEYLTPLQLTRKRRLQSEWQRLRQMPDTLVCWRQGRLFMAQQPQQGRRALWQEAPASVDLQLAPAGARGAAGGASVTPALGQGATGGSALPVEQAAAAGSDAAGPALQDGGGAGVQERRGEGSRGAA